MIIRAGKLIRFFEYFSPIKINAIALYPFILLSEEANEKDKILINHEKIHLKQQIELLVLPFYVWYLVEYFLKGYMGISFEKEAYHNDHNLDYLKKRKRFGFLLYL